MLELEEVRDLLMVRRQLATITGFGSGTAIELRFGHVSRAACLSLPIENIHGYEYEIAHLRAISTCSNCVDVVILK
jgi:putative aminopeptidase FrvX